MSRNVTATARWSSEGASPPPSVPGLWVLFTEPAAPELRTLALSGDGCELGRATVFDDGSTLSDAFISGRHAFVSQAPDGTFRLRDLGSRNGTWVDGVRVEERALTSGEVFRIGATFLQVQDDLSPLLAPEPTDAVSRELLGQSPELRALRDVIREIAPLEAEVMLLGPPGCGKERAAAALHAARGAGPMVAINCAAIPPDLAESELFGHVRGAFSGAVSARQGAFQRADGGTLLLDEVGELPLALQAKLLRVLQDGRVRPVGSDRDVSVHVRVVSATNRDVAAMVRGGAFRGDLYSRLARAVVRIPPLRDRPADIVTLAEHFLGHGRRLHPETVEALLLHPWPHNARDLEAVVALIRSGADPVRLTDAARGKMDADRELLTVDAGADEPVAAWPDDEESRRSLLRDLLQQHDGNVAHVARALGKRKTSVYRWIQQAGLDPDAFRR